MNVIFLPVGIGFLIGVVCVIDVGRALYLLSSCWAAETDESDEELEDEESDEEEVDEDEDYDNEEWEDDDSEEEEEVVEVRVAKKPPARPKR